MLTHVRKCLGFIIVFLYLHFFSASLSLAYYYNESFDSGFINSDIWNVYQNGGIVEVSGGLLNVKRVPAGSNKTPYVHTKEGKLFPASGPFSTEIRFRYSNVGNFGTAITLSADDVPQNGVNPDSSLNSFMKFMIYQDGPNGLSYGKILCDINNNSCNNRTFIRPFTHIKDTTFHTVKIIYAEDGKYLIYIDDLTTPEFVSGVNQSRPRYLWLGNSTITNTEDLWGSIEIDYIKVESLEQRKPVVILPGFGGSWDLDAVLRGVPGNNWSVPEFVKEYDGLKNSLINAGYKEDEDLFIFAYDWRKNLDTLADDLKAFLTEKDLDNKEINLIGHSMGGLVARSYLQKHNNEKIKVVTVGTPHKGILDAYGMWEGLTVWDAVWWQKALHFIATEVNRNPGEMKIEAARRNAPSIKDLLPTWQFLSVNGVPKSTEQMIWKNDFLLEKNSQIDSYLEKLVSGFSQTYQTKTALSATKQTAEDKLLGLWDDGKPILKNPFGFSVGDGYVTSSSSGDLFNKRISLEGGHGEVIAKKENIVKVLQEIGVATESAVGSNFESKKGFLAFKLNSPGKMNVCLANICNENLGIVFEDQKMLIIPDYVNSQYKVEIIADGETGKYNLIAGQVTETANWDKSTGELKSPTQTDKYVFEVKTNDLKPNSETTENNFRLFFPEGINTKKINTIRQEILREVDKAIKNEDVPTFDYQIAKWLALSDYMESVKIAELLVGFGFSDLESYSKGLYKAKNLPKTKSYYHEVLISLVKKIELALESEKRLSLKALDKKFQLIQLKHFLGHEFRSLF